MPKVDYEQLVKVTYPDAHHVLDLVSGYVFIRAMSPHRMFEMNIGIAPTMPEAWERAYIVSQQFHKKMIDKIPKTDV